MFNPIRTNSRVPDILKAFKNVLILERKNENINLKYMENRKFIITFDKHMVSFLRASASILLIFLSISLNAKTYYVDASGNDNNSGLSPVSAWKTLSKVNKATFFAGDSILFKRGCLWREVLFPKGGTATQKIFYGAYGSGRMPALWGSTNKSVTTDWTSEGSNIWHCNSPFFNVGNIVFENNTVGIKKWNSSDLAKNDDYWSDDTNNLLKIYSEGNPAARHGNIEICSTQSALIQVGCSNVTIQDFELKYGSRHGVQISNSRSMPMNVTIRNCEISWIGGSHLKGFGTSPTRYGNGIEIWDKAKNIIIEQNKIWEIWDTGITNQGSDGGQQDSITYRNNLVYNVGMGFFEAYYQKASGIISNILIENNTFAFDQAGWSRTQRSTNFGGMIYWSVNGVTYINNVIRNNIFYSCPYSVYTYTTGKIGPGKITMDYNCYFTSGSLSDSYLIANRASTSPNRTLNEFSQFQSETGQDVHSFVLDPKFVDAINGDFHIVANSPCINKGTISTTIKDLDAYLRDNMNDIGAYEYIVPTGNTGKKIINK
jgi:hypothetical protein